MSAGQLAQVIVGLTWVTTGVVIAFFVDTLPAKYAKIIGTICSVWGVVLAGTNAGWLNLPLGVIVTSALLVPVSLLGGIIMARAIRDHRQSMMARRVGDRV